MKKILKFMGILIIANIKKILIIVGILMISSFSYYGAVDENGKRIISFEPNETQSSSAFQSKVVEEQQEIKRTDTQLEAETTKVEEQKEEIDQIQAKQEDTKDESITVQKLSKVTQVEEKIQTKKQQKETKEQEKIKTTQQEKKQEEIKYTEVEVKIIEETKCKDDKHEIETGNSNKWFDSHQEAIEEYNKELEIWSQKAKSGAISYEELYQKCPYGNETIKCPNCTKWTLYYYYH